MKGLDKLLSAAGKDKNILAVILFGSYARKKQRKTSDIDVALILKNPDKAFEKRVRYSLIDEKIDVQVFQKLPVFIKIRVLKEGKILHCKDKEFLYDVAFDAIKEYGLFKRHVDNYLKAMVVRCHGQRKSAAKTC
ncbi:MAG: nucleotidyltransferase domain-containing protein [Candidatus Aenigmarchaeota archaeon]|nr:nucleotidyltransferase domain-containing protein [Candidatus Aenigmarchaeota archaeon]